MQQGTRTVNNLLPPELWIQIIRELPSHYQRSCLSVSKLFHAVSLPFVFANVNVRLGLLKDHYLANEDDWLPLDDEQEQEAESAIRRSCELLQHIAHSPGSGLAKIVKTLSVRAHSYDSYSLPVELLDALEDALSTLQLRAFAWYGCHPMPRRGMLDALSATSCETLEDVVLPGELVDRTPLPALKRLSSLSFLSRYADCYGYLDDTGPQFDSMRQAITATSPSLRSLGTFAEILWKCNIQPLPTVVDLTIVVLTDVDRIGVVFTHFPRLRSLMLLAGAAHYGSLADVLRVQADALPLLTAFSLPYLTMDADTAAAVAKFLETKPLLEWLEVGPQWDARSQTLEPAKTVLDVLPRLPRLRVLGMGLGDISTVETAPDLAPPLPLSGCVAHRLTALSLWMTGFRTPSSDTDTNWKQLLHGLRSCRFLYVSPDPNDPDTPETEALRRTLFDHPPPGAELVGFNEDMRWVERESETGLAAYRESWPLSKVHHRTAGEFGCEEWEWLMRHVDMSLP